MRCWTFRVCLYRSRGYWPRITIDPYTNEPLYRFWLAQPKNSAIIRPTPIRVQLAYRSYTGAWHRLLAHAGEYYSEIANRRQTFSAQERIYIVWMNPWSFPYSNYFSTESDSSTAALINYDKLVQSTADDRSHEQTTLRSTAVRSLSV